MALPRRSWSVALVVLAFAAGMPWSLGYVLPQRGTRSVQLAAMSSYSAFAVSFLVLIAWALRRWAAMAACALLLCAQLVTIGPLYVGDGDPDPARPRLRVMTANLYFGTADVAQVVRLVRSRHVDVLALQELSPGAVALLERAGLRQELPYAINRPALGAAGTGLWSRIPLMEVAALPAGFNACAADVVVGARRIRVRAFHPVTPLPTPDRWRRSFAVMRKQVTDDASIPTMLLGDFNATVHHRELRRLMGTRWRDAGEVAGAGLVRTWTPHMGAPSLLDLDHVLIDRGMTAHGFATFAIPGSDHRAVITDVALAART